jgi:hypothetical protein
MTEGTPISWIWTVFPLLGLAINLLWPRRRDCKYFGLVVLVLAAWLHGFFGPIPLVRSIGLAERVLTGKSQVEPEQVVSLLRASKAYAENTIFDVSLGLTLAAIFAALPADILARLYARAKSGAPLQDSHTE